ncbi:hypothetical protein CIB84_011903 [Bambusicola thoracicus]|uniref:Uncharacterized protein n=1 Tax=Bambusicola thoracicus TaxID=9083 RepID=A0A2P4SJQ5_BAMTH|nr:hypothetical protein CIB84_011903 [Bambusicola thoracicus]
MPCRLQSACCPPRSCCPPWDEAAIQEVPTGLEHYSTGRNPVLGDMGCGEGRPAPPCVGEA